MDQISTHYHPTHDQPDDDEDDRQLDESEAAAREMHSCSVAYLCYQRINCAAWRGLTHGHFPRRLCLPRLCSLPLQHARRCRYLSASCLTAPRVKGRQERYYRDRISGDSVPHRKPNRVMGLRIPLTVLNKTVIFPSTGSLLRPQIEARPGFSLWEKVTHRRAGE